MKGWTGAARQLGTRQLVHATMVISFIISSKSVLFIMRIESGAVSQTEQQICDWTKQRHHTGLALQTD